MLELAVAAWIQYAQLAEERYDIPQGLLVSICSVESNWRNVPGSRDEIGVCQIRPQNQRFITLRRGATGPLVVALQTQLRARGFDPGPIDGIFGPRTQAAITAFQAAAGLAQTGMADNQTLKALEVLWSPVWNIEYAALYLHHISNKLGTRHPAILAAAYNSGPYSPTVQYLLRLERLGAI